MGKTESSARRAKVVQPAAKLIQSFLDQHDGAVNLHAARLWECWKMVLGDELSALAVPLGRRKNTLLVGAEDNMAMQELAMRADEILDRVNAFMDERFFTRVQVELAMGRPGLAKSSGPVREALPPLPRPANLGHAFQDLDPESAVGKCYAAYVAYFERKR